LGRSQRGLRLEATARLPTVFESLVNAVACQQLSLEAGLSLLNRLADAHGKGRLYRRSLAVRLPLDRRNSPN
jgi:DNA-3-methyladenine glycosylase II